ncbi:MAG: hypothetical protein PUG02_06780 [Selenomonadaceae bacterium]|nr:hypothetical protein [Selenomonadaceae bacterium]
MMEYLVIIGCLVLDFFTVIGTAYALRASYVRRGRDRAAVWGEAAALLLACAILFQCVRIRMAFTYDTGLFFRDGWQLLPAVIAAIMAVCLRHDIWRSLLLSSAAFLMAASTWPGFFPWCLLLAVLLLLVRMGIFLYRAHPEEHEWIHEGLDMLPEGILFAQRDGHIILANLCMLEFMEGVAGMHYRNAESFWHHLEALAEEGHHVYKKENQTLLFRFLHSAWLLQRKEMPGQRGGAFEITASNVTELDHVTRELEKKNHLLAEQVEETKRLLQHAVEQERRKTLEKVRVRVHDIMGSRISMLQRLLTAPDPLEAVRLIPTVDRMLEELWTGEESPQGLLDELIRAYETFGIQVQVDGQLPQQRAIALSFVEILREAATNAICHGHADTIAVTMDEQRIRISDNGCGASPDFHMGGGLSAIARRAKTMGARLLISASPSFTVEVSMGRRQNL